MTNKDKVLDALGRLPDGAGICDDCLAELSGIQPRQTVNHICRELQAAGVIERRNGDCSKRNHNVDKLQNFFTGRVPKHKRDEDRGSAENLEFKLELVPPQDPQSGEFGELNRPTSNPKSTLLALKDQTDILSQWLFDANRYLDQVDPLHERDPFASRVVRCKAEGVITPALARKMLTLNNFPVQVVKERKSLDSMEWNLARKYVDDSLSDWKELSN
jgi:hypothetical protein